MQLKEYVSLAPYTTLRIGGPARWFAEAATEADILEGVAFAKERSLPIFVLGGGSNLLVSDSGFPGLVLHIGLLGIAQESDGVFTVAAGEDWDSFVSRTVAENYAGLECLAGIPGTVGGTPVQNVGAYGQEVAQTIASVRVLDLHSPQWLEGNAGSFIDLPAAACGFAYRRSIFNGIDRGGYIVSRVTYKLASDLPSTVLYPDLTDYFKDYEELPTLNEVATAVREIRRRKGMLLVDGDPDSTSAGSFFKNPVVTEAVLAGLKESTSEQLPYYRAGPGMVKIPSAWLLEHAGFRKGYSLGRAGISTRHTLALVNRGGATATEILALRDLIVNTVKSRYDINLEPEPVMVGSYD